MKKLIALVFAVVFVLGLVGCGEDKTVKFDFPFEVTDVENIEMYHYSGAPIAAEKKVVVAEDDIKNLYGVFDGLSLNVEKVEEITGVEVISFRFNLADGTNYELIYGGHGVKKGNLKSATGGFNYSTTADILAYWSNLNKELEAVPAEESELPK